MTSNQKNSSNVGLIPDVPTKKTCGIVMPIASMGEYSASHWVDVQNIIKEAVATAGYEARLVSESKDSTVIPKSIVQNLYDDDIVVCDVSGKNPNVMFELGMRLAFDKPVVLIKDSITGYSFDTSSIEHLEYPRDLRYSDIQVFKRKLADKLLATLKTSLESGYRSFLSNFATIKIAHLEQTTLSETQVLERILHKLDYVESKLNEQSKIQQPNLIPKRLFTVFNEQITVFDQNIMDKLTTKVEVLYGDEIRVRTLKSVSSNRLTLRISSVKDLSNSERHEILENLKDEISALTDLPF